MVTLVFVAVLLAAVALDVWIFRPWERKHLSRRSDHGDVSREFVVPRTLFFHPGHTWARLDGDGSVTVGVDDLARTLIGDCRGVVLPAVGARLTAGQTAFDLRQGPRLIRLAAPVGGTVTEVNAAFGEDPVRLRWQPYKEGWVLRIAPGDRLSAELGDLVIGRDAERWMRAELGRLDDLVETGTLGLPLEGALQRVNDTQFAVLRREIFRIDTDHSEQLT